MPGLIGFPGANGTAGALRQRLAAGLVMGFPIGHCPPGNFQSFPFWNWSRCRVELKSAPNCRKPSKSKDFRHMVGLAASVLLILCSVEVLHAGTGTGRGNGTEIQIEKRGSTSLGDL